MDREVNIEYDSKIFSVSRTFSSRKWINSVTMISIFPIVVATSLSLSLHAFDDDYATSDYTASRINFLKLQ